MFDWLSVNFFVYLPIRMLALLPLFCTVLRKNCTVLSHSESSNFFMYIIRSEIIRLISNYTYDIRPEFHDMKFNCHFITSMFNRLGQHQYFINAVDGLSKEQDRKCSVTSHFVSKTEKDVIQARK